MFVMIDLCVVPIGVGVSVSRYVAECQRLLDAAGLTHRLHAYGTTVEGEWDAVFDAVRRCHERLHEMGAPRLFSTLKVSTRTDRAQSMGDKVRAVRRELAQDDA